MTDHTVRPPRETTTKNIPILNNYYSSNCSILNHVIYAQKVNEMETSNFSAKELLASCSSNYYGAVEELNVSFKFSSGSYSRLHMVLHFSRIVY